MHRNSLFSRNFVLVAVGQIVSLFGNQILRYALPLYLLNQTGSSALFGIIMACSTVPMLLLFPVGGVIADRVDKRNIMVTLDFAAAALILLFCLLRGRVGVVPLMAATMMLLQAIQGAYQPAVKASVPALVDPAQLVQANAVVDLISSLAGMAGPVAGGLLLSRFGLTPILVVSSGCFAASAVMELFLRIPFAAGAPAGGVLATGLADLRESAGFLLRQRPVLWKVSLVYASTGLLLTSLVLIALPVLVTQHLGFAPDTANRLYGYAQGALAAGAVLGGLLAGLCGRRLRPKAGPCLLVGCALCVLPGGIALHALRDPVAVCVVLFTGCALLITLSTLVQIQIMSCIQVLTPARLIGKVISCVVCICMCANPLGQFVYGLVFERLGGGVFLPFYVAALLMVAVGASSRPLFARIDRLVRAQAADTAGSEADALPGLC